MRLMQDFVSGRGVPSSKDMAGKDGGSTGGAALRFIGSRRSWRKLHIGLDADAGENVAAAMTRNDVDDGSQVGPLLEQIAGPIASFTGDGAYDTTDVYATVTASHAVAVIVVPPRCTAVAPRPIRRRATITSTVSPNEGASVGRRLPAATNCPAWKPPAAGSSRSSAMACVHGRIQDRTPRSRSAVPGCPDFKEIRHRVRSTATSAQAVGAAAFTPRGSRSAATRWPASISRAMRSLPSGTTPSRPRSRPDAIMVWRRLTSPLHRNNRPTASTAFAARKYALIVMAWTVRRERAGDGGPERHVRQRCSCGRSSKSAGPPHHTASDVARPYAAVRIGSGNALRVENLQGSIMARSLCAIGRQQAGQPSRRQGDRGNEITAKHDHPDPLAQTRTCRRKCFERRQPPGHT
jgi:hypothetical protein